MIQNKKMVNDANNLNYIEFQNGDFDVERVNNFNPDKILLAGLEE